MMEDPVERGVPRSVRRRTVLNRLFVVALVLLFVGAVVLASVAMAGQQNIRRVELEIRESQERSLCLTELQADFEAAVGVALNAPPAPNPARDKAVQDIASSAARLKRSAKLCP